MPIGAGAVEPDRVSSLTVGFPSPLPTSQRGVIYFDDLATSPRMNITNPPIPNGWDVTLKYAISRRFKDELGQADLVKNDVRIVDRSLIRFNTAEQILVSGAAIDDQFIGSPVYAQARLEGTFTPAGNGAVESVDVVCSSNVVTVWILNDRD